MCAKVFGLFGFFFSSAGLFWVRTGLQMILSHMASFCFNSEPISNHMDPFQINFDDSSQFFRPGPGPDPGPGPQADGYRTSTVITFRAKHIMRHEFLFFMITTQIKLKYLLVNNGFIFFQLTVL